MERYVESYYLGIVAERSKLGGFSCFHIDFVPETVSSAVARPEQLPCFVVEFHGLEIVVGQFPCGSDVSG